MNRIILIALLLIASVGTADSDFEREISKNRTALNKIREEINNLRKQITKADIQSSSTLEQIKLIDKELSLLGKSRKLLEKENVLLQRKVNATRSNLKSRQERLGELKTHYAMWVVDTYKRGRVRNISLLLNSNSLNQAIIRAKYLQFFSEQEERLINSIKNEIDEINHLNIILTSDLQTLKETIRDKEREELDYLAKKDQKHIMVNKLKWTSRNLNKQLQDKKSEYEKLYTIILTLERKREQREETGEESTQYALDSKNFRKNKGKLPWPVKGKIIHKYGRQHDTKLKTTINNTGIDIRVNSGEKVRAIFTGMVSMITYLSGFGNTIIIDHGGGYYSVYSHLDDILVELDDLVSTGDTIGLAGDSGSLEGTKLHFALFANQKTENPQVWLRN